jgi:hypothetical protein
MYVYTVDTIVVVMFKMMNMASSNITCETTINRRIRSSFGVTADVVLAIWQILIKKGKLKEKTRIKHLLYMLAYFKTYAAYEVFSSRFQCTEKTFSTWVWYMADQVATLDIVSTSTIDTYNLI